MSQTQLVNCLGYGWQLVTLPNGRRGYTRNPNNSVIVNDFIDVEADDDVGISDVDTEEITGEDDSFINDGCEYCGDEENSECQHCMGERRRTYRRDERPPCTRRSLTQQPDVYAVAGQQQIRPMNMENKMCYCCNKKKAVSVRLLKKVLTLDDGAELDEYWLPLCFECNRYGCEYCDSYEDGRAHENATDAQKLTCQLIRESIFQIWPMNCWQTFLIMKMQKEGEMWFDLGYFNIN